MQLEGKVAIVTGASKGIGKAIAMALGREGANVIVNYHTDRQGAEEAVAEIEKAGRKGLAVQGDTSQMGTGQYLVAARRPARPVPHRGRKPRQAGRARRAAEAACR